MKRNAYDKLGRCNANKRGPKVEEQLTPEQIEWARKKQAMRRANRQSDSLS